VLRGAGERERRRRLEVLRAVEHVVEESVDEGVRVVDDVARARRRDVPRLRRHRQRAFARDGVSGGLPGVPDA